jgi:hypothetical protein
MVPNLWGGSEWCLGVALWWGRAGTYENGMRVGRQHYRVTWAVSELKLI